MPRRGNTRRRGSIARGIMTDASTSNVGQDEVINLPAIGRRKRKASGQSVHINTTSVSSASVGESPVKRTSCKETLTKRVLRSGSNGVIGIEDDNDLSPSKRTRSRCKVLLKEESANTEKKTTLGLLDSSSVATEVQRLSKKRTSKIAQSVAESRNSSRMAGDKVPVTLSTAVVENISSGKTVENVGFALDAGASQTQIHSTVGQYSELRGTEIFEKNPPSELHVREFCSNNKKLSVTKLHQIQISKALLSRGTCPGKISLLNSDDVSDSTVRSPAVVNTTLCDARLGYERMSSRNVRDCLELEAEEDFMPDYDEEDRQDVSFNVAVMSINSRKTIASFPDIPTVFCSSEGVSCKTSPSHSESLSLKVSGCCVEKTSVSKPSLESLEPVSVTSTVGLSGYELVKSVNEKACVKENAKSSKSAVILKSSKGPHSMKAEEEIEMEDIKQLDDNQLVSCLSQMLHRYPELVPQDGECTLDTTALTQAPEPLSPGARSTKDQNEDKFSRSQVGDVIQVQPLCVQQKCSSPVNSVARTTVAISDCHVCSNFTSDASEKLDHKEIMTDESGISYSMQNEEVLMKKENEYDNESPRSSLESSDSVGRLMQTVAVQSEETALAIGTLDQQQNSTSRNTVEESLPQKSCLLSKSFAFLPLDEFCTATKDKSQIEVVVSDALQKVCAEHKSVPAVHQTKVTILSKIPPLADNRNVQNKVQKPLPYSKQSSSTEISRPHIRFKRPWKSTNKTNSLDVSDIYLSDKHSASLQPNEHKVDERSSENFSVVAIPQVCPDTANVPLESLATPASAEEAEEMLEGDVSSNEDEFLTNMPPRMSLVSTAEGIKEDDNDLKRKDLEADSISLVKTVVAGADKNELSMDLFEELVVEDYGSDFDEDNDLLDPLSKKLAAELLSDVDSELHDVARHTVDLSKEKFTTSPVLPSSASAAGDASSKTGWFPIPSRKGVCPETVDQPVIQPPFGKVKNRGNFGSMTVNSPSSMLTKPLPSKKFDNSGSLAKGFDATKTAATKPELAEQVFNDIKDLIEKQDWKNLGDVLLSSSQRILGISFLAECLMSMAEIGIGNCFRKLAFELEASVFQKMSYKKHIIGLVGNHIIERCLAFDCWADAYEVLAEMVEKRIYFYLSCSRDHTAAEILQSAVCVCVKLKQYDMISFLLTQFNFFRCQFLHKNSDLQKMIKRKYCCLNVVLAAIVQELPKADLRKTDDSKLVLCKTGIHVLSEILKDWKDDVTSQPNIAELIEPSHMFEFLVQGAILYRCADSLIQLSQLQERHPDYLEWKTATLRSVILLLLKLGLMHSLLAEEPLLSFVRLAIEHQLLPKVSDYVPHKNNVLLMWSSLSELEMKLVICIYLKSMLHRAAGSDQGAIPWSIHLTEREPVCGTKTDLMGGMTTLQRVLSKDFKPSLRWSKLSPFILRIDSCSINIVTDILSKYAIVPSVYQLSSVPRPPTQFGMALPELSVMGTVDTDLRQLPWNNRRKSSTYSTASETLPVARMQMDSALQHSDSDPLFAEFVRLPTKINSPIDFMGSSKQLQNKVSLPNVAIMPQFGPVMSEMDHEKFDRHLNVACVKESPVLKSLPEVKEMYREQLSFSRSETSGRKVLLKTPESNEEAPRLLDANNMRLTELATLTRTTSSLPKCEDPKFWCRTASKSKISPTHFDTPQMTFAQSHRRQASQDLGQHLMKQRYHKDFLL